MTRAEDFIVVEFDLEARFIKKLSLKEFNERRKLEFKDGRYNSNMILLGVFETDDEAKECMHEHKNIDHLIESVINGQMPY